MIRSFDFENNSSVFESPEESGKDVMCQGVIYCVKRDCLRLLNVDITNQEDLDNHEGEVVELVIKRGGEVTKDEAQKEAVSTVVIDSLWEEAKQKAA